MPKNPAISAISNRKMELGWSDLEVLLAVCRAGSLSGAARTLGQNHSTIFRRVNAIEDKTGVRFFERLPEGYKMTEAGETALRYAERVESEVHSLSREVLGQDKRLQGKIRVTAPEGMAARIAPPLFAEFCKRNPEVSIEMLGATSALDLGRREADVAIRATRKPPDASLGRKVCEFRFGFYAAPHYLQRYKGQPLTEQKWAIISGTLDWLIPHVWKKKAQGESQIVFTSSATEAVLNTAAEGVGLTFMPCYLGDADKRLVRVGRLLEWMTIELWVLTHPDLRHTARVKALMSFLFDALKKDADLFEGKRPNGKRKPSGKKPV
jgi:DNA-binding transcriptional LysR family regulator